MTPQTTKPVCRRCNLVTTQRVQRSPLVKIGLFWLPIKRYKCHVCNRKFYLIVRKQLTIE